MILVWFIVFLSLLLVPTAEVIEETSNPAANKFVPNFKRHPDFHYANKSLYTDPNQTKDTPQVDPSRNIHLSLTNKYRF